MIAEWMRRADALAAVQAWAEENEGTGELFNVEQVREIFEQLVAGCASPSLSELWVDKNERMPEKKELDQCGCVLAYHEGAYGACVYRSGPDQVIGLHGLAENKMIRYWMPLPGRPKK